MPIWYGTSGIQQTNKHYVAMTYDWDVPHKNPLTDSCKCHVWITTTSPHLNVTTLGSSQLPTLCYALLTLPYHALEKRIMLQS